jgi:hypothetical protein
MHDALRQRLLRKIESLPDEQVYQALDFIEFLESKYAQGPAVEASGLQKFAETLEDKLRSKAVSPATIREAFQLISAADRVLSGVSSAGRQILSELGEALEGPSDAHGKESGRSARGRGTQGPPSEAGGHGAEEGPGGEGSTNG